MHRFGQAWVGARRILSGQAASAMSSYASATGLQQCSLSVLRSHYFRCNFFKATADPDDILMLQVYDHDIVQPGCLALISLSHHNHPLDSCSFAACLRAYPRAIHWHDCAHVRSVHGSVLDRKVRPCGYSPPPGVCPSHSRRWPHVFFAAIGLNG